MRRTKRFAGFALAACMGVSLLVNVPAGTVSAKEAESAVVGEETAEIATDADAEMMTEEDSMLEQAETVVTDVAETSEADFEWDGTKITKYKANGADVVIQADVPRLGIGHFQARQN